MPESIRYRILLNLQAALQAISIAGGYFYDVADEGVSIDPTVNLLTAAPLEADPFFVVMPELGATRRYQPAFQIRDELVFSINARKDMTDQYSRVERPLIWERLAADVEKAVRVDPSRGGLVMDTLLGEPQPFVGVGSPAVLLVNTVRMPIHRTFGDPLGAVL
jgi:hypothetical protein